MNAPVIGQCNRGWYRHVNSEDKWFDGMNLIKIWRTNDFDVFLLDGLAIASVNQFFRRFFNQCLAPEGAFNDKTRCLTGAEALDRKLLR